MSSADQSGPPDLADLHVARWRDHWVDLEFDDEVEAIVMRMSQIRRYFIRTTAKALAETGIQAAEYDTLHQLMIRDTPGRAAPSELAEDLGLSGAGMTGRLDALEKAGWIQRTTAPQDRRRIDVEITAAGLETWRRAMDLRGRAEDELINVLPPEDKTRLAQLLRVLTLRIEA